MLYATNRPFGQLPSISAISSIMSFARRSARTCRKAVALVRAEQQECTRVTYKCYSRLCCGVATAGSSERTAALVSPAALCRAASPFCASMACWEARTERMEGRVTTRRQLTATPSPPSDHRYLARLTARSASQSTPLASVRASICALRSSSESNSPESASPSCHVGGARPREVWAGSACHKEANPHVAAGR